MSSLNSIVASILYLIWPNMAKAIAQQGWWHHPYHILYGNHYRESIWCLATNILQKIKTHLKKLGGGEGDAVVVSSSAWKIGTHTAPWCWFSSLTMSAGLKHRGLCGLRRPMVWSQNLLQWLMRMGKRWQLPSLKTIMQVTATVLQNLDITIILLFPAGWCAYHFVVFILQQH